MIHFVVVFKVIIMTTVSLFDIFSMNAECNVAGLGNAVISLLKLVLEDLRQFPLHLLRPVPTCAEIELLFEAFDICALVHKIVFDMHRAVEIVVEPAPAFKYLFLILLISLLVIDILEGYRLRVIIIPHTAYTVREHPLKGYRLLRRPWNVIFPAPFLQDRLDLPLLFGRHVIRQLYGCSFSSRGSPCSYDSAQNIFEQSC